MLFIMTTSINLESLVKAELNLLTVLVHLTEFKTNLIISHWKIKALISNIQLANGSATKWRTCCCLNKRDIVVSDTMPNILEHWRRRRPLSIQDPKFICYKPRENSTQEAKCNCESRRMRRRNECVFSTGRDEKTRRRERGRGEGWNDQIHKTHLPFESAKCK